MSRACVWVWYCSRWELDYPLARKLSEVDAKVLSSLIQDPGSEDDVARATIMFMVDAVGTMCNLSRDEFSQLVEYRRGKNSRAATESYIRVGGESVLVVGRISPTLVTVYRDSSCSYEIVGCL